MISYLEQVQKKSDSIVGLTNELLAEALEGQGEVVLELGQHLRHRVKLPQPHFGALGHCLAHRVPLARHFAVLPIVGLDKTGSGVAGTGTVGISEVHLKSGQLAKLFQPGHVVLGVVQGGPGLPLRRVGHWVEKVSFSALQSAELTRTKFIRNLSFLPGTDLDGMRVCSKFLETSSPPRRRMKPFLQFLDLICLVISRWKIWEIAA